MQVCDASFSDGCFAKTHPSPHHAVNGNENSTLSKEALDAAKKQIEEVKSDRAMWLKPDAKSDNDELD